MHEKNIRTVESRFREFPVSSRTSNELVTTSGFYRTYKSFFKKLAEVTLNCVGPDNLFS